MNFPRPSLPGSTRRTMGAALSVCAALSCGAAPAQTGAVAPAAMPNIGFVVTERVFAETRAARTADAAIKAEFAVRARANAELFTRLRNLTAQYFDDEQMLDEPERTRRRREVRDLEQEAERKQIAYRDALLHRKNVERDRIAERARLAIAQIARDDKLDVVLYRGVIWARPGIDITDKLIRQLDQ